MTRPKKLNIIVSRMITALDVPLGRERMTNSIPMLTGMPAFGYMPIMMIELGLYGLISGLVMQLLRSGKLVIDLYAALIIAMLGGRVITGILRALIFAGGSYSWSAWATGYFVSCLPGIILQLILLPTIYVALERAHLLPVRYAAVSATAEAEAA